MAFIFWGVYQKSCPLAQQGGEDAQHQGEHAHGQDQIVRVGEQLLVALIFHVGDSVAGCHQCAA